MPPNTPPQATPSGSQADYRSPPDAAFRELAIAYLKGQGYHVAKRFDPDYCLCDFVNTVVQSKSYDVRAREHAIDSLKTKYGSRWEVCKTAMAEGAGATGGYLVPPEFSYALMGLIVERSFILPRANVLPMSSRTLQCPTVDVETVQAAGTNALLGGLKYTWGNPESTALTESEPSWRLKEAVAWDLIGRCTVSNQTLADTGPEGEAKLMDNLARGALWMAEWAFLQGGGAGQQMPLGIINAPASISITRSGSNVIAIADIDGMTSKLLPYCWTNAIWAAHPSTLVQIQAISSYFINVELGGLHKVDPVPAGVLATRPLFITDKVPKLGSTGDLVLFDPSLYVVGKRSEVVIDASTEGPAFPTNQTDLRVWLRFDGFPQLSGNVTLLDASSTASAYIYLHS